jgi:hypothetical protein
MENYAITPFAILLMILGSFAFSITLITIARTIKNNKATLENQKVLTLIYPIMFAGCLILAATLLFSLCYGAYILTGHSVLNSIAEASCNEVSINDEYKLIVVDQNSGSRDVSLENVEGKTIVVWIDAYAISGNYFLGEYTGSYFWVDLQTGGFRHLDDETSFNESLRILGIQGIPEFSSAYTICDTHNCLPCTTHTPSP